MSLRIYDSFLYGDEDGQDRSEGMTLVGPHLHFHIGDEYSLNGGDLIGNEGLPFVFDSFEVAGQKHRFEMPVNNTVMRFSEMRSLNKAIKQQTGNVTIRPI